MILLRDALRSATALTVPIPPWLHRYAHSEMHSMRIVCFYILYMPVPIDRSLLQEYCHNAVLCAAEGKKRDIFSESCFQNTEREVFYQAMFEYNADFAGGERNPWAADPLHTKNKRTCHRLAYAQPPMRLRVPISSSLPEMGMCSYCRALPKGKFCCCLKYCRGAGSHTMKLPGR